MENAVSLAAVMGPVYVVVGLSVLLYAKSWRALMDEWERNHYTLFPLMFIYIVLGLIAIRMYNVWEWNIWLIVTLVGWILFLKGVFYFIAPGSWIKATLKLKSTMALLYVGGVVAIILGGVLSYYVYFVR